ncbi:VacJ family lipoprotein [uncultured Desulfobacter sp.]|uniref:MlaA family lipoprotein n=1 Tax=uncultured Desulfobacter sp. TaxID=240139 RepID=UPI002AAB74C1|nr:VacJ family lipoprotein [uncultured Desulfobacter sp.]
MKYFQILIVMFLTLTTGQVVAGNTTDQTGQTAPAGFTQTVEENSPSDTAGDNDFEADIFQDDHDHQTDQDNHAMVADPLEGVNRAVFVFNDKLYMYLLKPLATGYSWVVPTVARKSVKNFFYNLVFPLRFVNDLLQGKGEAASMEFCAFFINTTLGFGGLNDFAQKYVGIRLQDEDFGQTLGVYGIGNGIYLVLPVLGPSSLRDAVGRAGTWFIDPINYLQPDLLSWGVWGLEKVNWTSFRIQDYDAFKEASIDPYTAMRNAYIQNRNALVKDVAGAQKWKNRKD